ncbi:cytochrome c oxidase subunit 4 [Paramicrobacterium agarici]|uniref:Cytochrome c oxidase polypeptide 4 n=1 Tax=Paramicrobacterium agarici TaxID=630514 RepID=A0A2A9DZN3_9MICO|nr:cytochrome c oxidase subunit 4 [Microbacterium agarici]PFG31432.1 cytochrome c oxidase subunit IV [Microbacterium agarici]TQO21320.1 cytochrome c oxidase subunit IV [Microbacterium agarici]
MVANIRIFWIICVFFAIVATIYGSWGLMDPRFGQVDWAGTTALGLVAVLSGLIAFYLGLVHRSQGGVLPEDRPDANIDDGDPELGHFSPWSWWPILLAGAAGLVILGLAVGFWIAFIGAPLVVVALVGWVYEYYRGYFAR